jgi:hypothetical protein
VGYEGFIDFTKMAKDLSKASLLNDDDKSWGKDFVDFKEMQFRALGGPGS